MSNTKNCKILVVRECGSITCYKNGDSLDLTLYEWFRQKSIPQWEIEAIRELTKLRTIVYNHFSIKDYLYNHPAMKPLKSSRACRYNKNNYCEFFKKEVDCLGCTEYHS